MGWSADFFDSSWCRAEVARDQFNSRDFTVSKSPTDYFYTMIGRGDGKLELSMLVS